MVATHDHICAGQSRAFPDIRSVWTSGLIAGVLGAIAAFSFAPWHWPVLLAIGLSGLLGLLDQAITWRRALLLGWLFGFGHFTVGLHWVVESFQVDAQQFGALSIPAVLGLSAYLASFPALACLATKALGTRGPGRVLVFAAAWSATEWLRGTVLTGFPWNLVAYVWTPYIEPLQAASVLGVYGLGFVTVVLAGIPRLSITSSGRLGITPWPIVALAFAMGVLWGFGKLRLANAFEGEVADVRLRLVQASIPQKEKWDPAMRERILDRYRELSVAPAAVPPTHILWPESALPFVVTDASPELHRVITSMIPTRGALLTGADRRSTQLDEQSALHNSLVAIDQAGFVLAAYDKAHLVPFGEYIPQRDLLPLRKMTAGTVDFVPGPGRTVLSIPGLPPFGPLICYEAIFPSGLAEIAGALWLLNVTNDAWFGASAGPYQHFDMARVRAVEAGVPLVRVANTGISAVVDAYGRVRASLTLNQVGVLDTGLPAAIPGRTLYAQWGDTPLGVMLVCVVAVAGLARMKPWSRQPRLGEAE